MEGYGFPPRLALREDCDGFWPTADTGFLDGAGYLALAGRADDFFKTELGHLVNPGMIADALMGHPRVTDAVVMPVRSLGGPVIGAMVETDGAVDPGELRAAVASALPPWLHPHILAVTSRLPRLAGGKADRDACRALLMDARGSVWTGASAPPAG